ncbi:hypothetical protein HPB50_009543 [Hyalomma asiaticum]|uniref:Uncharacterized protein n=1 Tax=Hyalomma asiaticum TaxID=266040 RepID=A0ACB7T6M6_HYAAI|nr:hypothetical protein HPB50_009543 [Hyalomma asiaticum]
MSCPENYSPRARKATRKGAKYCCVVDCHNSFYNVEGRDPPVKFYRFPGKWYERERRRAWTEAVRRVNPDGTPWQPKENSRICSVHFVGNRKSDILHHPAYVPTIFPPVYHKQACKARQTEGKCLQQKTTAPPHQAGLCL